MRQFARDSAVALGWAGSGAFFAFSGLYFMQNYSSHHSQTHQLFHLLGLALGVLGILICLWLLAAFVLASVGLVLQRIGHKRVGRKIASLSPSFVRRLLGAVVGLTLLAGPAQAVDLGFTDSTEAPTPTDSVTVVDEPDPAQSSVPEPDQSHEPARTPTPTADPTHDQPVSTEPRHSPAPSPTDRTSGPGSATRTGSLRSSTPAPTLTATPPVTTAPSPSPTEDSRSTHTTRPRPATPKTESQTRPSPTSPSRHPEQPRRQQHETTRVVMTGDSLWSIAAQELGPSASEQAIQQRWQQWYAANSARIGANPDLIMPGMVLNKPSTR